MGKKRPCPVDELCSALDALTARWYEAFETRVTASQSTHRSEWSSPSETKPREKGSRRSGVDQTRERGIHCSPCAKCRSVGRRCFACCSGDALDAEDNVVDRTHDRARMRTTGQSTTVRTWPSLLQATKEPTARSRPMATSVSPVRAFASRAQETPGRNIDLVQVCHSHERLGSDSEVTVLEQVSTGIYDPGMALLNHGRTEKPFPEQEAGASRAQETPGA